MALLKIARMGHPVLSRRAEPVTDPTAPEIRRLVADMIETMADAGGIGLAAPQVHAPLRLFVMRDGDSARVLVNPVLSPLDDAVEEGWEGCLSIPGLRGVVPRARRLAWEAEDLEGRHLAGEAEGLAARVMQHEHDHLDGVLYLSRMTDLRRLGFNEELARRPPPTDAADPAPTPAPTPAPAPVPAPVPEASR